MLCCGCCCSDTFAAEAAMISAWLSEVGETIELAGEEETA